jgi:hypothetical protein
MTGPPHPGLFSLKGTREVTGESLTLSGCGGGGSGSGDGESGFGSTPSFDRITARSITF